MVKVFNGKLTNQKTGRQLNLQHLHLKATHQKDTQNRKIYTIKVEIQLATYANESSLSSTKYQSSIDIGSTKKKQLREEEKFIIY